MKYLKYFDNKQDYTSFFSSSDFIRPNVSFTEDSDITYFNPVLTPKDVAGSVVLWDNVNNKKVFVYQEKLTIEKYPISRYTPIGVVVIPRFHDVYGTGECGVMSLKLMSENSPDEGTNTFNTICFGYYKYDIVELPSLPMVPIISNSLTSNDIISYSDTVNIYLATSWTQSNRPNAGIGLDTNAGYYGGSSSLDKLAPSPYLETGNCNMSYCSTDVETNCLSDFKGKENTSIILNYATGQSDWKTATVIIDDFVTEGYYPAACCCWRFHTVGTKQGDWYLPAMGELGYCFSRYSEIQSALKKIIELYGSEFAYDYSYTSNAYLSSTKYDSDSMNAFSDSKKMKTYVDLSTSCRIRAFIRL